MVSYGVMSQGNHITVEWKMQGKIIEGILLPEKAALVQDKHTPESQTVFLSLILGGFTPPQLWASVVSCSEAPDARLRSK